MSDQEINRTLGRIEGMLGEIKDHNERHYIDDNARFSEINKSLQYLNKKMNFGSGFASGIGAVIGSLSTLWFKGHN